MFNYEDILAQMKSGTSAEDIAKAFTDTLNKAIQKQEEDNKAKEAAARIAAEKAQDAEAIGRALSDYMKKYHNVENATLSGEDVMSLIDTVAGWDIKVKDLGNGVAVTMKGLENSIDKTIDKFFKKYGL